jgi:hypothetical protein
LIRAARNGAEPALAGGLPVQAHVIQQAEIAADGTDDEMEVVGEGGFSMD